jgi:hypothetical protein
MDSKADDAPSELIHNNEHPMALQKNGFTPEQVNAPEAILGVPKESQPRWPIGARVWPVMCGKDASHHIFIDVGTKRFINLLCDPWAAKPWFTLLHFDDGPDECLRWTFGAGFSFAAS